MIITQKTKRTGFNNSYVYLIFTRILNLDILCLNKLKITENFSKSNELRAKVNPRILSTKSTLQLKRQGSQ